MEDATSVWPLKWADEVGDPDVQPSQAPEPGADSSDEETLSVGEIRRDRWFLEERGGKKVPKRLDVANSVQVSSGGPLLMRGNITLIDEDGTVSHANEFRFCRCGASRAKPLCDERHVELEFLDNGRINAASDCMPSKQPQTITVTCVKDGPLKFQGFLRIYNRKGQECSTMRGALCRCGKSANKPFCDCV